MLDINFIRAHRERVEDAIRNKGYADEIDLDHILQFDDERRNLSGKADELRRERNQIAGQMKNGKPEPALIERGKTIKQELAKLEGTLAEIETSYIKELKTCYKLFL